MRCSFWQEVRKDILQKTGKDIFKTPPQLPFNMEQYSSSFKRRLILNYKPLYKQLYDLIPFLFKKERSIAKNRFLIYETVRDISKKQIIIDSSKSTLPMKWFWMQKPDEFKIIHLVRDGRGFIKSNLRKGKDADKSIHSWINNYKMTSKVLNTLPASAHIFVKYEDLCANTEKELQRICNFLGIDYEPQMLQFRTRIKHNIDGNRMRLGTDNVIKLDESWRTSLDENVLKLFKEQAQSICEKLGYQ